MAGKSSRVKGHAFERKLAKLFRRWFPDAATSRAESQTRDSQGVDLVGTGLFNVQAKAVEKLGSYHRILAEMPDEPGQINLITHKRNRSGVVVVMSLDDFAEVLDLLKGNGAI